MQFEVEKKFWVDDLEAVKRQIRDMGVSVEVAVEQTDYYFNHPARDFGETDEALRLRRIGDQNFITYKGARIDSTTKTRRELETALVSGPRTFEDFSDLLKLLGFRPVMTVRKLRRKAHIPWEGETVELSLDEIDQLGTFVELELTSDAEQLERAKGIIGSLSQHLRLDREERRSYLELLLLQLGP